MLDIADNTMKENILVKKLIKNYQEDSDRVALRRKKFGIWKKYSWKDYYENVKWSTLGLISLGLTPGDRVGIFGDTAPEWLWTELAAQAAGGCAVPIFPDSTAPEAEYILSHCEARFVVVDDQEQVDKILETKENLPSLQKCIFWDPKGLYGYDVPILSSFADLIELGKKYEASRPGTFEQKVDEGNGDNIAVICYSSGTTGLPKGGILSQRNLVNSVRGLLEVVLLCEGDDVVSWMSPAWVATHATDVYLPLLAGAVLNFSETPETAPTDIREIAPHFLLYPTRMWENLSRTAQVKILDAGWLARSVFNLFLRLGYLVFDIKNRDKKPGLFLRFLHKLGWWLVYRPVSDSLGLVKSKYCGAGGTAVGPELFRFFGALGINLKQGYGATEMPVVSFQSPSDITAESVGEPIPGVEIRISETGEILFRGDGVFVGYYKDPEGTELKKKDGWVHSGDAGYIDDTGRLIFIDRMADLVELPSGKFSPQYIENRLKFSPYIKDCFAIGGGDRHYVTAIINIDYATVGNWAEKRKKAYTTFADLSQKTEVYDLIERETREVNALLPEPARIRRFINLYKELDPDEAEVTRTRKLRRGFLEERYKDVIDALYSEAGQMSTQVNVKYRDGREARLAVEVKPRVVEEKQ